MGVEPIFQPWEGRIIPIYYTREKLNNESGIMNNDFFIYYVRSKKNALDINYLILATNSYSQKNNSTS